MRLQAALCPARRAFGRTLGIIEISRIRNAFVKRHGDICAKSLLHLRRNLRRKELSAAVDVRAEHNAFLGNLAHSAQAEHLEAAAVRQHTALVVHKFMQTTSLAYKLMTGTQEQMVGVGQNHLTAHVVQLLRRQRLYRCLRTYRHEHRRLEGAVRRMQTA